MELGIAAAIIEVCAVGIAILIVRITGKTMPPWVPMSKWINKQAKGNKSRLERLYELNF